MFSLNRDAYIERQRRELISLRSIKDKIDNDTYIRPKEQELIDKNKELRSTIREKDCRISRLEKEKTAAEKLAESRLSIIDGLRKEVCMQAEEINKLKDEKEDLQKQVDSKTQEVADKEKIIGDKDAYIKKLESQNAKLVAQKNRDFTNSSKSSSQCPFSKKKIKNSRDKTGKKPGAQPGHEGHSRPEVPPDNHADPVKVPDTKKYDEAERGRYERTGEIRIHYGIGIHFEPVITPYISEEFIDKETGKKFFVDFPDRYKNEVAYEASVDAVFLMLTQYCNCSIDKAREFISSITNGLINPCKGYVSGLGAKFSEATIEERKALFNDLLCSAVVLNDGTNMKVNGKQCYAFVTSNGFQTLFIKTDKKGFEALDKCPLSPSQTIVHDGDTSYRKYGKHHQQCHAHLLRYLLEAEELDKELTWAKKMSALLKDIIHKRNHKPGNKFTDEEIKDFYDKYDKIIAIATEEFADETKNHSKEGKNLYERFVNEREDILYFIEHPEVPLTNNESELANRKIKRKFKQVITLRSDHGAEELCDSMSMIITWQKTGAPIYESMVKVFEKSSGASAV